MEKETTTKKLGRKKILPEGARITSFSLTEDERLAVKKFVGEMRREKRAKELANKHVVKIEDFTFKLLIKVSEEISYALISIYDNRSCFSKVERHVKDAAIIGFKDAVSKWENAHPRKYDEDGRQIIE